MPEQEEKGPGDETPWREREPALAEPDAADSSIGPPEAQLDHEPSGRDSEGAGGRAGLLASVSATAWLALGLALIIAVGLFWVGGELHYQSCVQAANARAQGADDSLTRLVRTREINGCSRLPF